jgi:hypothetical protein
MKFSLLFSLFLSLLSLLFLSFLSFRSLSPPIILQLMAWKSSPFLDNQLDRREDEILVVFVCFCLFGWANQWSGREIALGLIQIRFE